MTAMCLVAEGDDQVTVGNCAGNLHISVIRIEESTLRAISGSAVASAAVAAVVVSKSGRYRERVRRNQGDVSAALPVLESRLDEGTFLPIVAAAAGLQVGDGADKGAVDRVSSPGRENVSVLGSQVRGSSTTLVVKGHRVRLSVDPDHDQGSGEQGCEGGSARFIGGTAMDSRNSGRRY